MFAGIIFSLGYYRFRSVVLPLIYFIDRYDRSFALILFVIQILSKNYLKRFLGNREVALYREENLIMKNCTVLEPEDDVTH